MLQMMKMTAHGHRCGRQCRLVLSSKHSLVRFFILLLYFIILKCVLLHCCQILKRRKFCLFRYSVPSVKTLGSVVTRGLELAAFFIQFLQWWHSEQTRTDITALPVPDPPPVSLTYTTIICCQSFCSFRKKML